MNHSEQQMCFDLTPKAPEDLPLVDGLAAWREACQWELAGQARKLGLPIGHRVRVDFSNSPSLEGMLFLAEPVPTDRPRRSAGLALRIGGSVFRADEISACVALD